MFNVPAFIIQHWLTCKSVGQCHNIQTPSKLREKNILVEFKNLKTTQIHHNCAQKNSKHVIERKREVTGRRGRWRKQLLDDARKREGTGNRKSRHLTTLCGELVLEEIIDVSSDRLKNDEYVHIYIYIYIYIHSVPGGMDKTSGECSLC